MTFISIINIILIMDHFNKSITGSDSALARDLVQGNTIRPLFKWLFVCSHIPTMPRDALTEARVRIIPFPSTWNPLDDDSDDDYE